MLNLTRCFGLGSIAKNCKDQKGLFLQSQVQEDTKFNEEISSPKKWPLKQR